MFLQWLDVKGYDGISWFSISLSFAIMAYFIFTIFLTITQVTLKSYGKRLDAKHI